MHSIVTTFRGADIKVEVANFCAAMDTLIDQDENMPVSTYDWSYNHSHVMSYSGAISFLK